MLYLKKSYLGYIIWFQISADLARHFVSKSAISKYDLPFGRYDLRKLYLKPYQICSIQVS